MRVFFMLSCQTSEMELCERPNNFFSITRTFFAAPPSADTGLRGVEKPFGLGERKHTLGQ